MYNRREFLKQTAWIGAAVTLSQNAIFGKNTEKSRRSAVANGDTYTVNMRTALNIPPFTPRKITIPDTGGFKVLKGDFHIHTLFSDGSVMPSDRVREAVQNGLDVISITDHIEYRPYFSGTGKWKMTTELGQDYNLWYNVAKPDADKSNLLLIHGAEITKSVMPPGHFNALFAKDVNPIAAVVDDWHTMLQVAADQGCFLLWNHPGWQAPKSGGIEDGAPIRFTKEHENVWERGLMHGIELFNGSEYYPVVSDWCNERDLAIFANSDIHPSELIQYGLLNPLRPITLVLAKERTVGSVREAMFAKRTIGWAANILWGRDPWLPELFKAAVNIKTVTPGTVELTNKSSLPITVTIGSMSCDLQKDIPQQVYRTEGLKTLTVTNWMIGMNKPLEVPLKI